MVSSNIEILGHVAYTLIFFSFLVRKILWLRTLAIVASFCSITYNSFVVDEPLWVPIFWNTLFILVNARHIAVLLWEKREVKFTGDARYLYEEKFNLFSSTEFKNLLDLSFTRTVGKGHVLLEKDIKNPAILVILQGEVGAYVDKTEVASLGKGEFIGEMSFLTNELTSAKIITKTQTRYLFWEHDSLINHLMRNPKLLHLFEGALSRQVIEKLQSVSRKEKEEELPPLPKAA